MQTAVALDRLRAGLEGRYSIEHEVGSGGMATVYLAYDVTHKRQVALKALHPHLATVVGPERFLREIDITARMSHRRILPLHDSGQIDGIPYYIMPYVKGESLHDRLKREIQLPIDDALAITRDVAEALSYAHAQGVVHRDIKPGNILLDADGAVVADFGIARAIDVIAGEELTSQDVVVGTPEYMSPEQGQAGGRVDARSDIYSLGCVLYHMLAGEPPFTGPTAQAIIARQMAEAPRSLRVTRSTVSASVEYAIECALAKVPADRPQTAERFVEMFDEPVSPTPDPTPEPEPDRKVPRRVLAAFAILALALVAWRLFVIDGPPLDDNRIVVFPMVDLADLGPTVGEHVGVMITNVLEHSDPLRFEQGIRYLSEDQQRNYRFLATEDKRAIARERHARYFLDGTVGAIGDSAVVALVLTDARDGTEVARASAGGPIETVARLGWEAMVELLPDLVDPARPIDREALDELLSSNPAANLQWIEGEQAYNRSDWEPALEHFIEAVRLDSGLAFAAIKGAQAASWLKEREQAQALIDVARTKEQRLPPKYRALARGLSHYYTGWADSAVEAFEEAVATDSLWPEAWMALGEAHHHLRPVTPWPDSAASAAFENSRLADSLFTPPIYHLAELALREGDIARGAALMAELASYGGDSTLTMQLDLMARCVRDGPETIAWDSAVTTYDEGVYLAASAFATGAKRVSCSSAGFSALLASPDARDKYKWNALIGLQGLLLAQLRFEEAEALIDSAVEAGAIAANFLYLIDAEAGAGMETKADHVLARFFAEKLGDMPTTRLWFHGLRRAHLGQADTLAAVIHAFEARADTFDLIQKNQLLALRARQQMLRNHPDSAITYLGQLKPVWHQGISELWRAFTAECLLEAQLRLEIGDYEGVIPIATQFDSWPTPLALVYLRSSVELRLAAAEALRDASRVEIYTARLAALTPVDLEK